MADFEFRLYFDSWPRRDGADAYPALRADPPAGLLMATRRADWLEIPRSDLVRFLDTAVGP